MSVVNPQIQARRIPNYDIYEATESEDKKKMMETFQQQRINQMNAM